MTKNTLNATVQANRDKILSSWSNKVYATYPFDTAGFLRSSSNQFANPVGGRTINLGELLLDCISGIDVDLDSLKESIEEFVRVRAVQDFSTEHALAVLYLVKESVFELCKAEITQNNLWQELWDLSSRLDGMVLLGFGAYMRSRENMWNLKLEDFKRRNRQIMRRAELLVAADETKTE